MLNKLFRTPFRLVGFVVLQIIFATAWWYGLAIPVLVGLEIGTIIFFLYIRNVEPTIDIDFG